MIEQAIRTASRQTLLHRFFSPIRDVPPELLRRMLSIDRVKETCIVGLLQKTPPRLICGARYVRLEPPATAEIAITVHDDFQRQGLGRFLLELLINLAREDGVQTFEADVMASNTGMLSLFRKVFPKPHLIHRQGDVYHLSANLGTNKDS